MGYKRSTSMSVTKSVAVLLVLIFVIVPSLYAAGIVHLVVAIDTEPNRFKPGEYNQQLDLSGFDDSSSVPSIFEVMNSDWRNKYEDDFGNAPKITWFVMTHEAFRHAENGNPAAIYDVLLNHKSSIDSYGDEIAWHYHLADWMDLTGNGDSCWNQLLTFDSTAYAHGLDIELAERNLNYLLLKRGFFPGSFRSGWTWENSDFSNWLEEIVPFDFSANPGYKNEPGKDRCRRNVNDWSRIPRTYSGYSPNHSDYQRPGAMKRSIFRTDDFRGRFGSRRLKGVLNKARTGEDQLICITTHSFSSVRGFVDSALPDILKYCDSLDVRMRFQTASEAAASLLGVANSARLKVEVDKSGDSLIISVNDDIFQKTPYCVLELSTGLLARIYPYQTKNREWIVGLPNNGESRFACAVSNLSGRTAVKRIDLHHEE